MTKDYPNGWQVNKLGSFVISEKGKKPKYQQVNSNQDFCYPYIDIEAFEKNIIKSYTDGKGCVFCSTNDFLMVWDGSRSGYVGKGLNGALGSTLVRINFPLINNNYAYYFLQSKFLEINTKAKGSGTPHVDPDLLWSYDLPIPPLNEQHRIVAKIEELFSKLDKGIESLKVAQAQLKNYRQALLKDAFEGKLTDHWRAQQGDSLETPEQLLAKIQQERESRYQQQLSDWEQAVTEWEQMGKEGKRPSKPKCNQTREILIKEIEKLPVLPDYWQYIRFNDLIESIEAGKSFKCDEREPTINEVGVAKVSAVTWGKYNEAESKTCTDNTKINQCYFINKHDFIISRANTIDLVGACVIVNNVTKRIMLSDKTLRVNFINNNKKKFIMQYLRSKTGRQEIMKKSTGNQDSMRNIGQEKIREIYIPLCSIAEAEVISEILDKQMSVINKLNTDIENQLNKSQSLRQAILKKAFAGELVPQDPADEPASELLARIAEEKAALAKQTKALKTKKGTPKP